MERRSEWKKKKRGAHPPVDLHGVAQHLLRQAVALQLVQNQTLRREIKTQKKKKKIK